MRFLLSFFIASNLVAFNKIGTTGAVFLKIGVGARASGLAGAFVSLADDPSTSFWNPGGFGFLRERIVESGYNFWFAGIRQGYASLSIPLGKFTTVGLGINSLTSGKIGITTLEEPEGNGLFYRYSATVLSLSVSRLLSSFFSLGITVKGIQEVLWRESARSFAFDFGALYYTEFKGLTIGISLSNIGSPMHLVGPDLEIPVEAPGSSEGSPPVEGVLKTDDWPLPVIFRIGLTEEIIGKGGLLVKEGSRLRVSIQGTHYAEARQEGAIGIEWSPSRYLFLRGGYKIGADEEGSSFGISLALPFGRGWARLDYAITDMGRLGSVHRISLLRSL